MNTNKYRNLWKVVEMLLLLGHGQATVEKGFCINKKVEVENMKELSYVSQRLICDYINSMGDSLYNIKITNIMSTYVSNARQKHLYETLRGSETPVIPEQEKKKPNF
ncbi:hypothetical protein AVEN_145568-1 [Araneus ventricosus]|uniref:HAT C-terminal dimerisation domain-containing protein n=1 Tax=Araneus ventricosus TaxID=182803 RepID=A0A4Y2MBY6_ARAVE|nr:hypothetical protein AVEN_145568-1 [Araneus ventricosus]